MSWCIMVVLSYIIGLSGFNRYWRQKGVTWFLLSFLVNEWWIDVVKLICDWVFIYDLCLEEHFRIHSMHCRYCVHNIPVLVMWWLWHQTDCTVTTRRLFTVHSRVPLSSSSVIWHWPKGSNDLHWEGCRGPGGK